MKKPRAIVTDHALIRYLERVHGVDIDGLRNRIGRAVDNGVDKGATGVKIHGVYYRLRGKVVTTVLAKSGERLRRMRK